MGPTCPQHRTSLQKVIERSARIVQPSCMRNIPVHFYGEREVIGSRGVPVLQLGLRRKLIERRIYFDRVEKPDILFQVVVTCVVKDPSPVIVVPSTTPQTDPSRLLTPGSR